MMIMMMMMMMTVMMMIVLENIVPMVLIMISSHGTETTHWDHPELVNTFKSLIQFNTIRFKKEHDQINDNHAA